MKFHVLLLLVVTAKVAPRSIDTSNNGVLKQKGSVDFLDVDATPGILNVNKDNFDELEEGDIRPPKEGRNTALDEWDVFWKNGTIPITYGNTTTLLTKAAVDEARREYELRTCLSFPQRTDEEDYIEIQVLGGCWSYVGVIGGLQTVSIGVGCEQMSTVVHEFMHAIGVWHEQSRADRDDYIEIIYEPIPPDLAYNFDNYGFNETDDRRVAYDFDSVMHYDKTAFSMDGNITIQTRDPAFEDVIGQRSGFSEGDVTKIARMYDCSDTLRITNSVNFEEETIGGYSQVGLNTDVLWKRQVLGVSDATGPTTTYLPKFDSTYGVDGEGGFMYLDTSGRFPGQAGAMKSMRYRTNVEHQCLEYSYFMNLNSGSQAIMYVYLAELDDVTGEIVSYGSPIRIHNSHTHDLDVWWIERMTISAPSAYRLVFYAKTGGYYNDIIAIDDVSIVDKECDTGLFQVPDYASLMNTYEVDEYIVSPVMYTAQPGYAFQILVWPNGRQPAIDAGWEGYMSISFRLIGGIYDNQLQWPFNNQFVKFVITDQGPNPTERMNYYYNFLTDSTSSLFQAYRQPDGIGSPNIAIGYSAFMKKEKFYTRMYLKRNIAYFSVQITDMRPYENSTDISAQLRNPVLRKTQKSLFMEEIPDPARGGSPSMPTTDDYPPAVAEETKEQGMMEIGTAALIILTTTGAVFIIMSLLTCCVAHSYRKKQKSAPAVMNNVRFGPGLSVENNVKYADRKEYL